MYDIFGLKRSDTLIKRTCTKIGSALVAKTDISLIVPTSYEAADLLSIDDRNYSLACAMYTNGKEYAVLNAAATMEISQAEIGKVMVKGFDGEETECYEFKFKKGDRIHPTGEVPKNAQLSYPFINHLILMGKTIPFFDKDDVDSILDSIPRFCGFGLPEYGYTNHFTEMIVRDVKDKQVPGRLVSSKYFVTIPFSSVILNVSSIVGKNRGGYLEDGITSSALTTSKSSTGFEKVVRA